MGRTRVLVVSADEEVRRLCHDVSRTRDYELVLPENAEQIRAHCDKDDEPELILIDLDDTRHDGVRLLRTLADDECPARILVVGSCETRTLAAAQRVGSKRGLDMAQPLRKPVHDIAVVRSIQAALATNVPEITADDIRSALDRREFELHYQPLVHMKTQSVHGAEALLRWTHPEYGRVEPTRVIPVAEREGLLGPLTSWVVRTALDQYAAWHRDGWVFQIAVNVEAQGLRDPGFADHIAELVQAAGVKPTSLVLEVTESQTITEEVDVLETLTRLRLRDVHLAIDDFGTGYSSLGRLHRMPFSELKIDKSFVMAAAEDKDAAVIVRSIGDLGRNLGMTVVAEGVATREAWDLVSGLECDVAQGYFVSRPLSAADFTSWLYRWGVPTSPATELNHETRLAPTSDSLSIPVSSRVRSVRPATP